jgi:hypothetical protein
MKGCRKPYIEWHAKKTLCLDILSDIQKDSSQNV